MVGVGERSCVCLQEESLTSVVLNVVRGPIFTVVNNQIVMESPSLTTQVRNFSRNALEERQLQSVHEGTPVDDTGVLVTTSTYQRRAVKSRDRWTPQENVLFFEALRQFGTDFTLLAGLFRGRTRNQIKAKFKREEKNNPKRMQWALSHHKDINPDLFMKIFNAVKKERAEGLQRSLDENPDAIDLAIESTTSSMMMASTPSPAPETSLGEGDSPRPHTVTEMLREKHRRRGMVERGTDSEVGQVSEGAPLAAGSGDTEGIGDEDEDEEDEDEDEEETTTAARLLTGGRSSRGAPQEDVDDDEFEEVE